MSSKLRMSFESHVVRRRQQGWTLALLALFWARSESAGLAPGTRLPSFRLANREKIRVPNALTGLQPQEGSRSVRSTTAGARQAIPLFPVLSPATKQTVYTAIAEAAGGSCELQHICHPIPLYRDLRHLISGCTTPTRNGRDVGDPPGYKHTTWDALYLGLGI